MNLSSFKKSLSGNEPPHNASVYLKALWYEAKGEWNKAHILIQDAQEMLAGRQNNNASWIHAYLHRKQGDNGNADYWYSHAGKKRPSVSLEMEWEEIVIALM